MNITLKYPDGDFTQAELAAASGVEKAAVYLPMKEAIGKGIIVLTGTRPTGKRPSNLYRRANSSAPVPVPAPLPSQPIPEAPPTDSNSPGEPFSQLSTRFDDVLMKQDMTPPVVNPVPIPQLVALSAPDPDFPCPLCKEPMYVIHDSTGVKVWCNNPEPCTPGCSENVEGHGKNVKDAYEVACQKFQV